MTAVNTNDSPNQLPKDAALDTPTVIIRNPDTSADDCLFFLLTIFFPQWFTFFSAHGYGFSVRASPSNGCSEEAGMDHKTAFQKARLGGFGSGFCTRRFWGRKGMGMGTTCMSAFLFYFISVHSTAHGKPLAVDSSSYV